MAKLGEQQTRVTEREREGRRLDFPAGQAELRSPGRRKEHDNGRQSIVVQKERDRAAQPKQFADVSEALNER